MQEVEGKCPICLWPAMVLHANNIRVDCSRCGCYLITEETAIELREQPLSERSAATASGWVAETRPELIKTYALPQIRALKEPSVRARLDRFLIKLVRETRALGSHIELQGAAVPKYLAATYSQNEGELQYLIEYLHGQGLVEAGAHWSLPTVTPRGFAYVDDLDKNRESAIGFCAMWFNEEVLPLWVDAIEPAIKEAGYDAIRIDGVEHNNRIDDEIIASIRRSRFVVADLTRHRQGVYFEAGLAIGLGLPVVWMVRHDNLQETHFDNRQYNFIVWTQENLADASRRLLNRIESTIGRGPRAN